CTGYPDLTVRGLTQRRRFQGSYGLGITGLAGIGVEANHLFVRDDPEPSGGVAGNAVDLTFGMQDKIEGLTKRVELKDADTGADIQDVPGAAAVQIQVADIAVLQV